MKDESTTTSAADAAYEETTPESAGAAERSLRLLDVLAAAGKPMLVDDLAQQLRLPKSTTQRLCSNLAASGFAMRDIEPQAYVVGPAFRDLAESTLRFGPLRSQRHKVLKDLSEQLGETCNFTTLDGAEVIYLDRVEFKRPLRLTIDIGSHVPLHCTSSGKLLLAHMPEPDREALIAQMHLAPMTLNTIVERDTLIAQCQRIREQGYACDNQEFVAGLISIAVPVHDARQQVRATVSVHAPVERLAMDQAIARLPMLRAAASAMVGLI
ncbi:IclR family transcriptional regulator [Pseudorhodoferax soli]|uniref:IclR family transcriptional regulator n=1 Tax=Pseudorhodoferax soli TaxID=545864 RepID=A0A368X7M5_9BURK|nr:IclR family transcriptional regulator [Pseudorhodoferax soli]RCW63196.1 IclR family transcriptional regulator [Pseudorhodoferax soli]